MSNSWSIELLAGHHARKKFSCGQTSLDDYLRKYARQNAKLNVSRTYVLVAKGEPAVVGYYTVCTGSISFKSLPDPQRKRLPRYPIPTAHLARLAVDTASQRRGLGEILLFDCLKRICLAAQGLGIHAITVEALNENAKTFYQQYGFTELQGNPMHLYLPVATAAAAVVAGD